VRDLEHDARDSGTDSLQYDNNFWRFSLAVYAQSEVAQECLALQQALGLDVNVLLFCAWLGARAVALSRVDIEAALSAVAAWHENVIRPLRSVRQQVKLLHRDEFENFRTRVKSVELEAEQIEQAILFAFAKRFQNPLANPNARDTVAWNVNDYIAMKTGKMSAPHLIEAAGRFKHA
jgi:uncharacterized protein (TIGR02444 family)